MTPEYLEELADLADPHQLWRLGALKQLELPSDQRQQLDTGVALRRQASHQRQLDKLVSEQRSLLITPFTANSSAVKTVNTPADHQRLRGFYGRGANRG